MGQAFKAFLTSNLKHWQIFVIDRKLKRDSKIALTQFSTSDFVILAVKPQDLAEVASQISGRIGRDSILVSVAAGITITKLAHLFLHKKIVRCMPNMAITYGQGIMAWSARGLSSKEKAKVRILFKAVANNFEVAEEELIDVVTAISGSGPAYFFLLCDSLRQTAISLGLNHQQADLLVAKTFFGAAAIKQGNSKASYQELIKKIASKKGTTEAALKYFSKHNFARTVQNAVRAAFNRAREINHGKID